MKKIYKKILIVMTIVFFIGGLYLHSNVDFVSSNITKMALADSLESSAGGAFKINSFNKVSEDILFLSTLASLRTIKIDIDFLNDTYFKALKDNKIRLVPVKSGRNNPFGPMGIDSTISFISSPNIVTNPATNISTNSATLNGTLNIITGVTNIYFDYGINQQNLDNKINVANPSLIGTFIKIIDGLNPETNYFYKACAKISNVDVCGEVVSFTTN